MRWLLVALTLLVAGCVDVEPGGGVESLDAEEGEPSGPDAQEDAPEAREKEPIESGASENGTVKPEPWEWTYEGTLVGAGYCDGIVGGSFAGISSFPGEFRVPAGTQALGVRLTWDMPVPVCIYLTDAGGNWFVFESDLFQQLAQSLEVEPEPLPGTWSVWVAAKGAANVQYTVHVEGS